MERLSNFYKFQKGGITVTLKGVTDQDLIEIWSQEINELLRKSQTYLSFKSRKEGEGEDKSSK